MSAAIQKKLVAQICTFYGDPRLVSTGTGWTVSDRARAVIMKWLVGASLEAFLDIVSAVEVSHMWPGRRKFWLSQYAQGKIQEAWVALSHDGKVEARRIARESGSKELMEFGEIRDRNQEDKRKCLLLIRCGKYVIVEGSHNFKIHIFDSNHKSCPKLYQTNISPYIPSDIRRSTSIDQIVHLGNWQGKVKTYIERGLNG